MPRVMWWLLMRWMRIVRYEKFLAYPIPLPQFFFPPATRISLLPTHLHLTPPPDRKRSNHHSLHHPQRNGLHLLPVHLLLAQRPRHSQRFWRNGGDSICDICSISCVIFLRERYSEVDWHLWSYERGGVTLGGDPVAWMSEY
jgi:hypothetical protein